MINFYLIKKNHKIVKFYGEGHAEFKKEDEKYDLLCNTVSVIPQQVVAGLYYLGYNIEFDVCDGFLEVDLEKIDYSKHEKEVDALLGSMYFMLTQLSKDYSDYIRLIEKEVS